MPRQKNDGRGRLGGRQKGTPNKDNPLKQLLHDHSVDYYTPSIDPDPVDYLHDSSGLLLPEFADRELVSRFDLDLFRMKAADRGRIEVDLLTYHTPKMQAISADMSLKATNRSFADRLNSIANGDDLPPEE